MEKKDHGRKSKRFPVRWKAAVVFDKAAGKPILHTETLDLSTGGAAIHGKYADLTGTSIILLLAQPPRGDGETQKMLKIRARVVSTVQTSPEPAYRLGLSFVRTPDDGLDSLAEFLKLLNDADASRAGAAEPAVAQPAAGGSSRLAQLKMLAQAKQAEEELLAQSKQAEARKQDEQQALDLRVSNALERSYHYLKELAEQLNVAKPAFASKGYAMVGVPEFKGLTWEYGRVNYRARKVYGRIDHRSNEVAPQDDLWEEVTVYYRLVGNDQLKVARKFPESEKLKQIFTDNKIDFKVHEQWNDRGSLALTTFVFPCEVNASMMLSGNYETGKLLLKMRNVGCFGTMDYVLAPEAISDASLDELTGYIIGETSRIGPLLLQGA